METQTNFLDKDEMLDVLEEINEFTETPAFQEMLDELHGTPQHQKNDFIKNVVINPSEQIKRGIFIPEGMFIQRSYFTDERPTLFCVVKYLKDGKRKMTVTFDNESDFRVRQQ